MSDPRFHAVVLAGERPDGSPLARALELPAAVLAPLAGRPCIERVLDALADAGRVEGIEVCGPSRRVVDASADLTRLLSRENVTWREPDTGPAASALAAVRAWNRYPQLLTTGDHGLLLADVVDAFCEHAWAMRESADVVVGLVPYQEVARAFPDSKRTVLRFADGEFCGSNLFALLTPASTAGVAFWRSVEAERKRPWRIVRRLGVFTLLRYLLGRLPMARAFEVLSARAGCRVGWVLVNSARAAVDVDSEQDWQLAHRLLAAKAAVGPGAGDAATGARA